jgi:predicted Zn-dependent peptidase
MTYPTVPPTGSAPRAWQFPPRVRTTTASGLTVMAIRMPALPMVHARWSFRAGRTEEPPHREGLGRLYGSLARHGTARYDSKSLAEAVDRLGARLSTSVAPDNTVSSITALAEHLDHALDLLDQVALFPTFPESQVERERAKALEMHRHDRTQPEHLAGLWLSWLLYGAHVYGRPSATASGLESSTREDLLALHARLTNPSEGLLLVVGDIDPERTVERLVARSKAVPTAPRTHALEEAPTVTTARSIVVDRPGSEQTVLHMGQLLFARNHPDYLPMRVLNQVLGAGASSRLFIELREKQSLSYSPSSSLDAGLLGGDLTASLSCAPDKTETAVRSLRHELARIASEPIPATELVEAKRYIVGSFPQKASGVGGVASLVNTAWLHGLGDDVWTTYQRDVEAVSAEQVASAAGRWLRPDRVVVAVGPGEIARKALGPDAELKTVDDAPFEE